MMQARYPRALGRLLALGLCLVAGLLADAPAGAQPGPSEYDLKAAFVYQFLAYVTWPQTPGRAAEPLLIGVVGAPELADNLSVLAADPAMGQRPIEVRKLEPDADPARFHVVFVADEMTAAAAQLLRSAAANAVLTVTEAVPRPAASMINFEVIDSKVRFDVALGLAKESGMDISARLLQVALRVVEQP